MCAVVNEFNRPLEAGSNMESEKVWGWLTTGGAILAKKSMLTVNLKRKLNKYGNEY